MNPSRPYLPFLVASLLVVLLSACSLAEDITPPPGFQEAPTQAPPTFTDLTYPVSAADLGRGATLYAEKCAPCHGATGLGDGPQAGQLPGPVAAIGTPNLARASKPADWFTIVSIGKMDKFMPGFAGSLDNQQRWDVVAYVYSLSQPQDAIAQGRALYSEKCSSCHGVDGSSVPSANLSESAAQSQQSSENLFQAISSGNPPAMPAFANDISEDQRWNLVSYVRSLSHLMSPGVLAVSGNQPTVIVATPPTAIATSTQATQLAGTSSPSAASFVDISGKVDNGSAGILPANLTVTLHGYDAMQETLTQTTPVAPDGTYHFTQVVNPSGRVFISSVNYKGTTFNSDVSHTQATGATPIDLPVTIYESTTDAASVKIDRMHVFFDFSRSGIVQVVELFVASNPGKQAIVATAPTQPVLRFLLPKGANNLQFQDGTLGQRYVQTDNGFGDTQTIPPGDGTYQVLFAYDLAYDRKLDITLPVTRPVQSGVVMVPKGNIQVIGNQLQDGGERDVQGTTFHLYTVDNLTPDKPLTLTLNGAPNPGTQASLISGGLSPSLLIGVGGLAVALLLAGYWFFRQRRVSPTVEPIPASSTSAKPDASENADTLIDTILALDDSYQAGKLPEVAYRERRAELKARLAQVVNRG